MFRFLKTLVTAGLACAVLLVSALLPVNRNLSFIGNAYAFHAKEFEVKAAYIYHFTQFIKWPESAFDEANSPFNICLIGGNPFKEALQPIFERNYNGHPFSLLIPEDTRSIHKCHILYLHNLSAERQAEIISVVADRPVLTISSSPGFIEQGGNIGFLNIKDSVRFGINRDTSIKQGLINSAKLLEIAVQVIDTRTMEKRP